MIEWKNQHLPEDALSVENGIITTNSVSYPLFIDPQKQATRWVESRHCDLVQISIHSHKLVSELMECLRLEKAILVKDVVNSIDQQLVPLLERRFSQLADSKFRLHFSEDEFIDVRSPQVTLYLSSSQSNAYFLPDVYTQTTVINFTVSDAAIEEQLLGAIIKVEFPEIQEYMSGIQLEIVKAQLTEQQFYDQLLELINKKSDSQNILDDSKLVQSISQVGEINCQVQQNLRDNEKLKADILEAKHKFIDVAQRARVLYGVINQLACINDMYQISFHFFMKLFTQVIDQYAGRTKQKLVYSDTKDFAKDPGRDVSAKASKLTQEASFTKLLQQQKSRNEDAQKKTAKEKSNTSSAQNLDATAAAVSAADYQTLAQLIQQVQIQPTKPIDIDLYKIESLKKVLSTEGILKLFQILQRSLLTDHKRIFGFCFAIQLQLESKQLDPALWKYFTQGSQQLAASTDKSSPHLPQQHAEKTFGIQIKRLPLENSIDLQVSPGLGQQQQSGGQQSGGQLAGSPLLRLQANGREAQTSQEQINNNNSNSQSNETGNGDAGPSQVGADGAASLQKSVTFGPSKLNKKKLNVIVKR